MRTRSVPKIVLVGLVLLLAALVTREYSGEPGSSTRESWISSLTERFTGGTGPRIKTRGARPSRASSKAEDKVASVPTPDITTSCTVVGLVADEQGKPIEAARVTIRTKTE